MVFSGVFTYTISPNDKNATATEGGRAKFPKIFRERTKKPQIPAPGEAVFPPGSLEKRGGEQYLMPQYRNVFYRDPMRKTTTYRNFGSAILRSTYTTSSSFLRRVQSGNEAAWHDFYARYAGMIRAIGQKRSLTPEECDDLLIDVMVIFWKQMERFTYDRSRGSFRAFLARITQFAAGKIRNREHRPAPAAPAAECDYPPDVDRISMEEWRDFLLKSAMEDLKQEVDTEIWQVFYMLEFQHRTITEVAAITRRKPNNLYIIRHRCYRKLREIIAAYRERGDSELALHSHRNNPAN